MTVSDGLGGFVTKNVSVTTVGTADPIAAVNLGDIAAGIGGFKIVAENADDFVGFAVSMVGDVNGDGLADLLVGAQGDDQAGLESGAAYVVFGKAGDTPSISMTLPLAAADLRSSARAVPILPTPAGPFQASAT